MPETYVATKGIRRKMGEITQRVDRELRQGSITHRRTHG
jgi:hypothetical protein